MDMHVSEEGGVARFKLGGTIDEQGAADLKARFKALDLPQLSRVEFDFEDVAHIGSAGIGKLLLFSRDTAAGGGAIHIINTPPAIRGLFTELNLQTLFEIR